MINEYWIARRGLAYGILCSASGVSGAALPFLLSTLLHKHGHVLTLRFLALGLALTTGPLIPFMKPRLPSSHTATTAPTDWSFLHHRLFWIYSLSNLAMGLGYFLPALYLPSYASSLGLAPTSGPLLLALMSTAQVFGQLLFGALSDRSSAVPLNALLASSALVAAVAAFLCWGPARHLHLLVVFALLFGFFGAGYTALWARMGSDVCCGVGEGSAFVVFR